METSKQMKPPLSLSDKQLSMLRMASKSIPVDRREMFLEDLAKQLTGEPTDQALMASINAQMDRLPSGHFFTDSKPNNK
jgi:hypothetical protein